MEVLHQEVIPVFRALLELETNTEATRRNFRAILNYSVGFLRKDLKWLDTQSAKPAFCWGLVSSCCSGIHVAFKNFNWLHNYSFVTSELCKLFNTYCTGYKLTESQTIMVGGLPNNIHGNPSEDVKR